MSNLFTRKISPASGNKGASGLDVAYQVEQYFRDLIMTDQKLPPMYQFDRTPYMPTNASINTVSETITTGSGNYYVAIMAGTKPTQAEYDSIMLNEIGYIGQSRDKIYNAIKALSDRNTLLQFPLPLHLTMTIDNIYPHHMTLKFEGDDTLATVNTSGIATWWFIWGDTSNNHSTTYNSDSYPTHNTYKYYQNLGNFVYCIGDVSDQNGNGEIKFDNPELTAGQQFDFDSLSFKIPQTLNTTL